MMTFLHFTPRRVFVAIFALLILGLTLVFQPHAAASVLSATPVTWQDPRDVFISDTYAAAPAIAVRPQNNGAFLAWEEKDQTAQHDRILATRNDGLGSGFVDETTLDNGGYQLLGNVAAAHDSLGRIHLAWYRQASSVTIMYARSNPAGTAWELVTPIAVTASPLSNPRKNVAIAIGPDNRLHLIWGREEQDVSYTSTVDGINWTPKVGLPSSVQPRDLSVAVSTAGTVMAAWIDRGSSSRGDVYTALQAPNGTWTAANISQPVGNGDTNTYWPRLAADPYGGIRAVWADEDKHLRTSEQRGNTDIYYREWIPSGWSPQIVQVVSNPGESQQPEVRVDALNKAHIVWMDDSGRDYHNYSLRYSVGGAGEAFLASLKVVPNSWGDASAKDPSLDWANNVLQLGFSSNINDPQRDNYHTYGNTQAPPPTATPVPALPTPTLAPCTFYDVAPTDYFYNPVRTLCNLGAISGYGDGTFRPFLPTTRGQLAKILVVAEGWPLNTTGGPHFRDVPTSNPFYGFIETAYKKNIISGYSCGSGCLEYRWGNNVTRGQLSKIIVLAEGWPINTTGGPHFSDVLTTNPFYGPIETAYQRNIISGYSDGTFGWANNATRGQIAKIVALSATVSK